MGVGKGGQGHHSWILKYLAKKVVFLVLSGKNKYRYFWSPLEKFWKNPLVPPLEKILVVGI